MKPIIFNVDVTLNDLITPKGCSYLICELMKHLIYQREMMPYTFDRLKYLITKRRELFSLPPEEVQEDHGISLHSRLTAERHYIKAEDMYINLENAFKDIQAELETGSMNAIDEVVVIFGSTPTYAQNIFRIPIPLLAIGHKEETHPVRKHIATLFQAFISSDELIKFFRQKQSLTNMFIMLKMKDNLHPKNEKFLKLDRYSLPMRSPLISFLLKHDNTRSCDCDNKATVAIFCDTPSRHVNVVGDVIYVQPPTAVKVQEKIEESVSESVSDDLSECCNWFQYNCSIKGFKDSTVDGIAVANIWLKYGKPHSLNNYC